MTGLEHAPSFTRRNPLALLSVVAAAYLSLYALALWLELYPRLITGILCHKLREVAARLSTLFGEAGIVGRLGGEEFAGALRFGGEAAAACEAAIAQVRARPIETSHGVALLVTLSGDLAEKSGSIEVGYGGADAALSEAKNGGRAKLARAA